MEFTQLISPTGLWGKLWLAAHWERKLKKQDYVDIDLRELVASILARRAVLSLRATGHLLLGGCKVFARKCQILEEEVQEVRQKLLLAFSDQAQRRRADGGGDGDAAAGGGRPAALLREVDAELSERQDEATLLGGKRHVARLEDITLRAPVADLAASLAAGAASDELFGAMSREELEAALREVVGMVLPGGLAGPGAPGAEPDLGPDTLPLVGEGLPDEAEARGSKRPLVQDTLATDLDTPAPLDLDLPPPRDDDLGPELAPGVEEPVDVGGLLDEVAPDRMPELVDRDVAAKKRRRDRYIFDEVTEIPKAVYQAYIDDRSAITRDKILDYTIVLPHYSPSLPDFMTTYTDLCPELTECLRWGKDVAEKLRRQRQDQEAAALPGREEAQPLADLPRGAAATAAAPLGAPDTAAAALLHRAVGGEAGAAGALAPRGPVAPPTEAALLRDAPRTLSAAVLASGADGEDPSGAAEARVGYSGRTERMHRYLAREFCEAGGESLSYERLCRAQAAGRRALVAGSFFELLVLRTNGVVGLQQESPLADIQISKSAQWSA